MKGKFSDTFILVPILLLKEPNYPIGMTGFSV